MNFKSIGNNTMKNATRYCAGPAYYRMCSTDRLLFKTNRSRHQRKPSPPFSVSGIGQKKTVDAAKICGGGAENVVKTETQQTFLNGLLKRHFRHLYSAGSACIAHNSMSCAHRYGQLYLHCSLIYFWVPSSCFCIVISLSLRVK